MHLIIDEVLHSIGLAGLAVAALACGRIGFDRSGLSGDDADPSSNDGDVGDGTGDGGGEGAMVTPFCVSQVLATACADHDSGFFTGSWDGGPSYGMGTIVPDMSTSVSPPASIRVDVSAGTQTYFYYLRNGDPTRLTAELDVRPSLYGNGEAAVVAIRFEMSSVALRVSSSTINLRVNGVDNVASPPLPVDTWSHVRVVFDRAGAQAALYLNGASSSTLSAAVTNPPGIGELQGYVGLLLVSAPVMSWRMYLDNEIFIVE